jgi:hypothetical protein
MWWGRTEDLDMMPVLAKDRLLGVAVGWPKAGVQMSLAGLGSESVALAGKLLLASNYCCPNKLPVPCRLFPFFRPPSRKSGTMRVRFRVRVRVRARVRLGYGNGLGLGLGVRVRVRVKVKVGVRD